MLVYMIYLILSTINELWNITSKSKDFLIVSVVEKLFTSFNDPNEPLPNKSMNLFNETTTLSAPYNFSR